MKNLPTLSKIFSISILAIALATCPAIASSEDRLGAASHFQKIEQPLAAKIAVAVGSLGLISLELWWFLWSSRKTQQAKRDRRVQEVNITVDGGYEPDRIEIISGQTVRLNFFRKDPSSCLEKVLLPDFRRSANLKLNEVTAIEFTPEQPGKYAFQCGRNVFRGTLEVKDGSS